MASARACMAGTQHKNRTPSCCTWKIYGWTRDVALMSFRSKVFLSIAATVVLAVWIVAGVVSTTVTKSFERREALRTASLVSQFHRKFERRGADVVRRIEAIANSDVVLRIGVNLSAPQADTAQYYSEAQTLSREQSLDFLELVAPDGSIISSAEWPARFGYKENWLTQPVDWKTEGIFLRREELADGAALGLITVRTVKAGDGLLYVVGGQRLDKEFLDSLPATEGMRLQLYTTFDALPPAKEAPLIQEVRSQP